MNRDGDTAEKDYICSDEDFAGYVGECLLTHSLISVECSLDRVPELAAAFNLLVTAGNRPDGYDLLRFGMCSTSRGGKTTLSEEMLKACGDWHIQSRDKRYNQLFGYSESLGGCVWRVDAFFSPYDSTVEASYRLRKEYADEMPQFFFAASGIEFVEHSNKDPEDCHVVVAISEGDEGRHYDIYCDQRLSQTTGYQGFLAGLKKSGFEIS